MSVERKPGSTRPAARQAAVLVVSPLRNEAAHLRATAAAMLAQTCPPALWLAVDDESTDGSLDLLRELAQEIAFLEVLPVPPGLTPPGRDRLALAAVERAFNWGVEQVELGSFDYICKLDGDTVLPPDYFERLLEEFDRDPRLGVAGGALVEYHGSERVPLKTPTNQVSGTARVYRRECYAEAGGFPERLGADPIVTAYARLRGYRTRTFPELEVEHLRSMGSAQGQLRGCARHGRTHYIVHYGFLWSVLRSIVMTARRPPRPFAGLAFLGGYLSAAVQRTPRVEDSDFRRFVRAEQRARLTTRLGRVLPSAQDQQSGT